MTIETIAAKDGAQTLRPFPSIWIGLSSVILFFVIQLVVVGIIGIISVAISVADGSIKTAVQNANMAATLKTMAVPFMWSIFASGIATLLALGIFLSFKGRATAIGLNNWSKLPLSKTLIIAALTLAAAYGFNYAYGTFVDLEKAQSDVTDMIKAIPRNPVNLTMLFFAVSILPGITEELVFRGLLQNSLSHLMPAGAAIAVSAAIFGAVHGQLAAFPALMCLGAAYGYIYYKTGSLRINIALHVINNGLALALS